VDAFVETLYRELLGRWPEPSGLRYWAKAVAHRVPLLTVAKAIAGSPERLALLRRGLAPPYTFRRAFADALRADVRESPLSPRV
jgi:hypothetical protein